jgi:predicted TIM-barrel fold metal-dependent hydrolase
VPERLPPNERYTVISADCHCGPPVRHLEAYVPHNYRDNFSRYADLADEFFASGRKKRPGDSEAFTKAVAAAVSEPRVSDPSIRMQELANDGVVAEVLYANVTPGIPFNPLLTAIQGRPAPTIDEQTVGAHAYNQWLSEFCATDPKRMLGVIVVPMLLGDVEAACREVQWGREHGLNGGVLLPFMVEEFPGYNDPIYDPFWALCQDLNVPLSSHGGPRQRLHLGNAGMAIARMEGGTFSHRTLWYTIFGGVFERFPKLTMVFAESGVEWIPETLKRMDAIVQAPGFARTAPLIETLSCTPSERWAQNCYVGATFMSRPEVELRDEIGVDRIMWGSDYPHPEGTWPFTKESLRHTFAGIDHDEAGKLLGMNAALCYGLDLDYLDPLAKICGPTPEQVDSPLDAVPEEAKFSAAFRT